MKSWRMLKFYELFCLMFYNLISWRIHIGSRFRSRWDCWKFYIICCHIYVRIVPSSHLWKGNNVLTLNAWEIQYNLFVQIIFSIWNTNLVLYKNPTFIDFSSCLDIKADQWYKIIVHIHVSWATCMFHKMMNEYMCKKKIIIKKSCIFFLSFSHTV